MNCYSCDHFDNEQQYCRELKRHVIPDTHPDWYYRCPTYKPKERKMKNICWDCRYLKKNDVAGKRVLFCTKLFIRVYPDIEPQWYRLCPAFREKECSLNSANE